MSIQHRSKISVALPPIVQTQPPDTFGLSDIQQSNLIISMRNIDNTWVVVSRFSDDTWWLKGTTTNIVISQAKIDFQGVPSCFRHSVKSMIYRLLRTGREGGSRLSTMTLVSVYEHIRHFLIYVYSKGLTDLGSVSPILCANYVQKCREHRKAASSDERSSRASGSSLSKSFLYRRLTAVERVFELSQYTDDPMPHHPWPDESADHIANRSLGQSDENQTPLIPDDMFCALFQASWKIVQEAHSILDTHDGLLSKASERNYSSNRYAAQVKTRILKDAGFNGGYRKFLKQVGDIRTACYIVIASLSGCRNHELVYLRSGACYQTEDNDGETYWWMRSISTKTGEGPTEWLIPEAAAKAIKIMERWAKPFQAMLVDEINSLRQNKKDDINISIAQEHLGALFVGIAKSKGNVVRTMTLQTTNRDINQFARIQCIDWNFASHQFRRKFANYSARSQFGDLRYLKQHFKHWSMDMTLRYAMNESQEMALYADIENELEKIKNQIVSSWFSLSEPLAGGYGAKIIKWRNDTENIALFKDRKQMITSIANSTAIRSNGHAWCTADDSQCVGNNIERTRCGDCSNAVIGRGTHGAIYQGLYEHLSELTSCHDIGQSGKARVQRDLGRCRDVLCALECDSNTKKI